MSSRIYDVIIAGAGTMGLSAGYRLAAGGMSVLLIDEFDPPHGEGSHHGDTRIFRHAYSGESIYVQLALKAEQGWRELEEETGRSLFRQTGVVNLYPDNAATLTGKHTLAKQYGLPVTLMSASDIRSKWPGIHIPDHYAGLLEHRAGVLSSEECVLAYRELAERSGAQLVTGSRITHLDIQDKGVVMHTAAGSYKAERLLLTAGACSAGLLPSLPVQRIRKTIAWFAADERLFGAAAFPAFNCHTPHGEYYGFPSIDGSGLKIGRHDGGTAAELGKPLLPFGMEPEDEGDLRSFLEQYMPGAAGSLLRGRVCQYERTPDEHFIIDRHKEHPHVYIATGFSGHGFKFASAIGTVMSEWIMNGRTDEDLSLFSMSR
ncbi:N-methyl-L-tryptophan oxidase [Paenibacillus eucommiae]|uniref:Monomeric sarcosine oxidase n=1 Tax=Paenibacillus eucommiae TaxID=1355755 RepID=A0ABS4IXH4_9BACL|nr:N-methyl-L-tryptophan oxidase [Paenibacillus eucommiae]MBP1992252.1 monomeric sarcosine oxidase [Paenibacillus eucommiae]